MLRPPLNSYDHWSPQVEPLEDLPRRLWSRHTAQGCAPASLPAASAEHSKDAGVAWCRPPSPPEPHPLPRPGSR
jgi:hypothetical protein